MDIGTVAVVISVLVLAYQGRELAKHARIANQVASAETNRELLLMWRGVHEVFIEHPDLRAQFYDPSPAALTGADSVRLIVVSEMAADALQVGVETVDTLAAYQRYREPWLEYAETALASSASLRSVVRDQPSAWPGLAAMVVAFDASQPSPAAPAEATPPTSQPSRASLPRRDE
jgi:hypothetical protein